MRLMIFLIIFSSLFSCQSGQKDEGGGQQQGQEQAAAQPPAGEKRYPGLPLDTLQMLWNKCDFIDYVFYYKDFSVSQNQQADIRASLRHIADEAPAIQPACQPIGRIFYQVQGENRLEADLYFQEGCAYFVFYENGEKAYANTIMPAGIQFFNQIMSTGAQPPEGQ
ncbi:MAG: hypothetical protein J5I94_09065 [Phaeodactylibacter sp.]|nr:hypothetical protein [Phaeodactylibacter sp.]